VAFDFDNAVKVKESKESSSVTGNFDFDNAVKVPTNNNGMTAYDEWVYSEFDQDISKSLLKDMSEDDAGKAEFYRDKSKADFNAGIAEMDKIKSTEDVLTGKFWAGAIPYTKAVAGLFTRPFGVEPLADVTPEKLATIQKEHKVAYTIGDVVGGYAPFIAASVLFPQTLLASTSIFAGMGGLRESGRVKMEESMLTSGIKNAADIAKETVKMGLYAPIWHYSKALTFIGKPIVSALAIAGTRGAGVATLHKVFGEDLESALKQGGLIMGLSLVFELPMLGKTALGRGIINKAERDVFRKFGVKVKVNRGVVDASSERTSLFKLVKLFGQSMKHKVTKANTPNPKVENVQRHLTPKQGIEIVNPKTIKEIATVAEAKISTAKVVTPSKVARSIEAKAIAAGLTKGFEGLAGYDPITVDEQGLLVDELIKKDLNKVIQMVKGEVPIPREIRGGSIIVGLRRLSSDSAEIMKALAESPLVSETSRWAQEMRMLAESEPNSPDVALREVVKVREKRADKRSKKTTSKTKKGSTKDLKESIEKSAPSKDAWAEFIRSIEC